ncbi:hypothetical protein D3C76_1612460 [compost metagenome]
MQRHIVEYRMHTLLAQVSDQRGALRFAAAQQVEDMGIFRLTILSTWKGQQSVNFQGT